MPVLIDETNEHVVATLGRRLIVGARFRVRGRRVRWPGGTKLADVLAIYDIMELLSR
jgi:hypothetical protein